MRNLLFLENRYGVVKKALEAYGYEPGEKLKAFKEDVTTHNDLTFSMYTKEVSSSFAYDNAFICTSCLFSFDIHNITDENGSPCPSPHRAS